MDTPPFKLFLLDAMALIYRAHFAFSKTPRITSTGLNTGATFGFVNTLLEVIQKEKPTHLGVAFDLQGPTFRHTAFEAYKANRQEQPEDISLAIPAVKRILEAFNIPVLQLEGFEADDIIGTFAWKAAEQGCCVYMMTPDKDYCQLVKEHVYLYKPAFMGKGVDVMGVAEVLEKWEITHPLQVIDVLGLMGDAVDNIPGIPGIGEKTAKKLVQEFGSVENLIANADKLKGKQAENVKAFAQQGLLSKELATIDIAVPLTFDLKALEIEEPNKEALTAIFAELEFRTLTKRVFGEEAAEAIPKAAPKSSKKSAASGLPSLFDQAPSEVVTEVPEQAETTHLLTVNDVEHQYHIVEGKAACDALTSYLLRQPAFCFDTETDQLEAIDANLVGLSFCYEKGVAYYVPVPLDKAKAQEILGWFLPVFESESIVKVGQNIKYDYQILLNYGIELKGVLYDTMLAHYLLEPDQRHGMDAMANRYLGYQPISITELIGKKGKDQGNMTEVELPIIAEYAAEDADITWQLYEYFSPLLKEQQLEKLLLEVEGELLKVLAKIEREGVKVDTLALKESSRALADDLIILEQQIFAAAGESFNISSPKQMGTILFEKLKLDPKAKKTATGQYKTDEEVLSRLAPDHDIAQLLLDYRGLLKLKNTYVDSLPELINPRDGRIHTSFNQAVAATGRLSSTNPNLQNIPIRTERGREIRKAFVARSEEFQIFSADYSQIELRIMAAFSGDETMLQAFTDGKDIHAITASKLYKVPVEEVDSDMRRKAKTANFGIIYGISAFGLSQRLRIPRKEAAEIIDNYFREFPRIKQYMDQVITDAREQEYVSTILGRRRYLPDINSRNATQQGYAERNAINAPIQGSAADMIKIAMVNINHWMEEAKVQSKMILQVHDELVFEVHHSEKELMREKVAHYMKTALNLPVPMEIGTGFGENWLEAH